MNHPNEKHDVAGTPTPYLESTASVSKHLGTLRADMPDVRKAFSDLARTASRDDALDQKTKELIAPALGVAAHCDAWHC